MAADEIRRSAEEDRLETTHLLELIENDEYFIGTVMDTFGDYQNRYKMSSLQSIESMVTFLGGLPQVKRKIPSLTERKERDDLLRWYSIFLYLWGIHNHHFSPVVVRPPH